MTTYNERERTWLWLNQALGTNVRLIFDIVDADGDFDTLRQRALSGELIVGKHRLKPEQHKNLLLMANDSFIDGYIEKLHKIGVTAVTFDSADYPNLLRHIYDPPTVLYVVGKLHSDMTLPFAIIGSRKASQYGAEMSERFAYELAGRGFCIVSGMAMGCDSAAARGALRSVDNDNPTIAVLGSGVDVIYPPSGRRLYEQIAARGAVISELPPGSEPSRFSFPQRNRIISGISMGVLVAEAGLKSGTLITIDFAHDQGRDVFAIPGRLTDVTSMGTNRLIQSGAAKAVFDISDILFEYGFRIEDDNPGASMASEIDVNSLPKQHRRIYDLLLTGEQSIDEIYVKAGIPISDLNMYLTEMELSGIIKQLSHKVYSV